MNNNPNEFDKFRLLVSQNSELFSLIWRIGDGNGGWAIDQIKKIIGFRDGKLPPEKTYKKRKINGSIRIKVMERDAYRCKKCNSHKDLAIDHIIPESKGGTLDIENLQTLCRTCNSKKGVSQ